MKLFAALFISIFLAPSVSFAYVEYGCYHYSFAILSGSSTGGNGTWVTATFSCSDAVVVGDGQGLPVVNSQYYSWECTEAAGWVQGSPSTVAYRNVSGVVDNDFTTIGASQADHGFAQLPQCGPNPPCDPALYPALQTSCGGAENVAYWDAALCQGYCKTCDDISASCVGPCPSGETLQQACDVTSTDPQGHPTTLDNVCECISDCAAAEIAWGDANCPPGPGIEVTGYDCAANTGTCTDCVKAQKEWELGYCNGPGMSTTSYNCEAHGSAGAGVCGDCLIEKQNYENLYCKPVGKVLLSYDCAADAGICGNDLCDNDRQLWKEVNCSEPGQTLISFDCDTKDGICRDENDCTSKENAWKASHCTALNLELLDYDCVTDTGHCDDPNGCVAKEEAWKAKFCSAEGEVFVSYNCVADTGVCDLSNACVDAENNWKQSYCSETGDVFVSFDCKTGHGTCQHGSDFIYTPSDEEKALYTDRFNKFIDDMRHTPLFSLPDQVLGNIPSGGEPVYTVEMGQYGTVDIDLSNYNSLFSICRTIFLVCFSFAALRILLSHR
jgi:hypothetical protein